MLAESTSSVDAIVPEATDSINADATMQKMIAPLLMRYGREEMSDAARETLTDSTTGRDCRESVLGGGG